MSDTKQIPGGTIERSVWPPKAEGDDRTGLTCYYVYEVSDALGVAHEHDSWLISEALYKQAEQIEALREVAAAAEVYIDRLKARVEALEPYRDAVRSAHNGYDPECREVMDGLTEPVTPADAISSLLEETEALFERRLTLLVAVAEAVEKEYAKSPTLTKALKAARDGGAL
jgi:hypothetical protein